MAREHIATYLNDHLAGATGAVELLEHLEKEHADTEVGRLASELRADVEADRQTLQSLMERLEVAQSRTQKAAAWLGEKAAELKLRLDDPAGGSLRLFESLEVLSLGIEGKRSLWRALAAASKDRSLMWQGKPQLYGTQFKKVDGRWILWEVDPSITDEERAKWNVPPLAEQKKKLETLNAPSQ